MFGGMGRRSIRARSICELQICASNWKTIRRILNLFSPSRGLATNSGPRDPDREISFQGANDFDGGGDPQRDHRGRIGSDRVSMEYSSQRSDRGEARGQSADVDDELAERFLSVFFGNRSGSADRSGGGCAGGCRPLCAPVYRVEGSCEVSEVGFERLSVEIEYSGASPGAAVECAGRALRAGRLACAV